MFASSEISDNLATRIGIHKGFQLRSDHVPVVCDFPINCAGIAEHVIPVWTKNTVDKVVMNEDITSRDIDNFNVALQKRLKGIDKTQLSVTALYSQINSAILSAAVDTIATRKRVTYPKKVKKLKHYSTQDHMLHTWRKRMRGALRASRSHDLDAARKAVQRAEWPLSKLPHY